MEKKEINKSKRKGRAGGEGGKVRKALFQCLFNPYACAGLQAYQSLLSETQVRQMTSQTETTSNNIKFFSSTKTTHKMAINGITMNFNPQFRDSFLKCLSLCKLFSRFRDDGKQIAFEEKDTVLFCLPLQKG